MLRVATVFGFTAPGSSVVCLKYAPSPSASYLSSDFYFIFFKCCCICMRTRLCIIAFRRGFLWGTSLGSKPCSDSCLVNHLNKFSNKVPTSEVKKKKKIPPRRCKAQHRTPSTKFSVNNTRVIVQVTLPSQDGRLTCLLVLIRSNLFEYPTWLETMVCFLKLTDTARGTGAHFPSAAQPLRLAWLLEQQSCRPAHFRVTSPRKKKKKNSRPHSVTLFPVICWERSRLLSVCEAVLLLWRSQLYSQ